MSSLAHSLVPFPSVTSQELAACWTVIQKTFETASPDAPPLFSSTLDSLISRFSNHLGLGVPVQRAAVFVGLRAAEENLLVGRNPITVAGACILFATTLWGDPKPAKEISAVAGVQDGTIRLAYR